MATTSRILIGLDGSGTLSKAVRMLLLLERSATELTPAAEKCVRAIAGGWGAVRASFRFSTARHSCGAKWLIRSGVTMKRPPAAKTRICFQGCQLVAAC